MNLSKSETRTDRSLREVVRLECDQEQPPQKEHKKKNTQKNPAYSAHRGEPERQEFRTKVKPMEAEHTHTENRKRKTQDKTNNRQNRQTPKTRRRNT